VLRSYQTSHPGRQIDAFQFTAAFVASENCLEYDVSEIKSWAYARSDNRPCSHALQTCFFVLLAHHHVPDALHFRTMPDVVDRLFLIVSDVKDDTRKTAARACPTISPNRYALERLIAVKVASGPVRHSEIMVGLNVDHIGILRPERHEFIALVLVRFLLDERDPHQRPGCIALRLQLGEGNCIVDDVLVTVRFASACMKCLRAEPVDADRHHMHTKIDQRMRNITLKAQTIRNQTKLAWVDRDDSFADLKEIRMKRAFTASSDVD